MLLLLSLDHHQYQYVSSHLFILCERRSRMALFSVGAVLLFSKSTYGKRVLKCNIISSKLGANKVGRKSGILALQYKSVVPEKLAVF